MLHPLKNMKPMKGLKRLFSVLCIKGVTRVERKLMSECIQELSGPVVIDRIPMLLCTNVYCISACLSQINGKPHLQFGGMNMVFAGDFAQLPSVAGKENGSLYSWKVCVRLYNIQNQQAASGKAVWHQVTTIIILHQNMRQIAQSDEDKALRTSLINMRYHACTNDDIQFLKSHCVSSNPNISIVHPAFHNVSIITAHNINKDAINMLGSACFTLESGQQLIDFFSEHTISDKWNNNVNGMPKSKGHTGKSKCVPPSIQKEIWEQPPSSTTNQINGKLSLCIGYQS
ncbi:hypothetical protein J132_07341 [Termitomyces sp. J132]|nr:hypothetical protein J132_07341 [Termitomyces sp. J132]